MNNIEIQLEDSLKRVNFIFKNEVIYTKGIANHNRFTILGESFGPFEKGKEYRLPYFIAVPFIENKILKIHSREKWDNTDVQRFAISERDDQGLLYRENKFFLNKIKLSRFLLEKEVGANKIPKADLDRFNSHSINLIDNRLFKLLKLARSNLSLEDERKLTSSEKLLFLKLFELIKIWRNFFLTKN